jgi:hypothetical protein
MDTPRVVLYTVVMEVIHMAQPTETHNQTERQARYKEHMKYLTVLVNDWNVNSASNSSLLTTLELALDNAYLEGKRDGLRERVY